MTTDRKKIHIISISTLVGLLLVLFAPGGSGRILAALLLLPAAAITWILIKKRSAKSIYSNQVLMIIAVSGLLYLMLYYLSALHFGFTKTGYGFNLDIILRLALPIAVIIVTTEIIRYVLRAQKIIAADIFAYLICITADVLIQSNIAGIKSFGTFMDVVGLTLFPGIIYNLLYHYLTARYGYLPNIAFRAITVLAFYFIPYGSAISDSLTAFFNILIPICLYFFVDSLYEKKKRYALGNTKRAVRIASAILTVIVVIIMAGTVMLVSNQFKYGALVIATDSMTGEINKGDAALFERYDDQYISEGQVIVFEKNNSMIVHRVIDIKIINGEYRYFTQGDANEDPDAGYITRSDIRGLVKAKIPFIGYPTIWVRSLFSN